MGIDWFTFGAQIVNFLILIGLLWHFAYKPIIRAMDTRENSIRDRLAEADRKRADADRKSQELDEKHQELDAKRAELLNQAREEAAERRKELLDEARKHVAQSKARWQEDLRQQQQELATQLRRQAARHSVTAARQLVRDLANQDLEGQVVTTFTQRLDQLDGETSDSLRRAVSEADGSVQLVSTFELGDDQRQQLNRRINELVAREVQTHFETDRELLCGVELRVGERRIGWNAADYIAELDERVENTIAAAAQRATATQQNGAQDENNNDD